MSVETDPQAPRAERLFALLTATNDQGAPRFSDDELVTFLPLAMRSAGVELEPSWATQALFARLAQIVGATPADSDQQLLARVDAYYRLNPPSAALQQAFSRFCAEEAGLSPSDAFEKFVAQREPAPAPAVPVPARPVFEVRDPNEEEPK